ncbi:MAG: hypothetical protein N3E50_01665 [Candidatus Goldbacteria bacterium]|nr:hypothetical protein [Candidatus Goldiibacteriota bacterium]
MLFRAIKVYFQNLKFFLKLSLISIGLGVVSFGILLPVFQAGFGYIFSKMDKGESVYHKNIFIYLNKTLILFALWFILLIIFITSVIGIFLPVFVIAFLLYSPYVLVNEETGIFKALQRSCEIVLKNGLFKHLVITIFLIIFFLIGLLPAGLGVFITFPIISGYVGMMYNKYKDVR